MVEIFTGSGLGLERSSATALGNAGTLGNAATGTSGVGISVNADTGNLVVQTAGETLDGVGDSVALDAVISQTYNSLSLAANSVSGTTVATQGPQLLNRVGAVNAVGGTVQRLGWDGSLVTYTYNAAAGGYVAQEASGAYDKITNSGGYWYWQDGTTGVVEAYKNTGNKISSSTDLNGNVLTFTNNASNLLSQVKTSDGEYITLTYSGNNLTQLTTHLSGGATLTRTDYAYDSANRLISTTVDLSPADNSVTDGYAYTTTFAYVVPASQVASNSATANQISSVTQTDGSEVDFTYNGGRVSTITQVVNSTTSRTTTMAYGAATTITATSGSTTVSYSGTALYVGEMVNGAGIPVGTTVSSVNTGASTAVLSAAATASGSFTQTSTTVTDPQGNQTVLTYDGNGDLLSVASPAVAGGEAEFQSYTYDANGNVLTQSTYANVGNAPSGPPIAQSTNTYDGNGNLLTSVDLAGDTTSYTYNTSNSVLSKTVYTTAASGGTAASGAETTYYVYDANNQLNFTISAAGDVTANVVNSLGQVTSTLTYPTALYTGTRSPSSPPTLAQMTSWQTGLSTTQDQAIQRTDYTYDLRGNLATQTSYSATDTSGNGLTSAAYSKTTYVYDQAGELVSKLINDGSSAATSAYDGLGRVISSTDALGHAITTAYNNAANTQTVTYANGLVDVSSFDKAGELTGTSDTGTGIATTTTSYIYDSDGNLRVSTDPNGVNTYYFYDNENRKTGEVNGDGYLTEYKYDAASRLTATVTYATALTLTQLSSLAPSSGVPSVVSLTAIQPFASATDNWNWTVYNAAGEVSQTINAVGSVTGYTYDGTGAVTQTTQYATPLTAAQLATLIANTPGNNLVYNAGFNGTSGWHTYDPSGILAAPVAGNSQNVQILKVAFNATASNQSATIYGGAFSVTPGEKLNIQTGLEAYGPINFISLGVVWLNSSGNQISTSQVASNLSGSTNFNTQVSGSVIAPAGAVSAFIQLLMATSGFGSGAFDLDEPKVTIANPTLAPVAVTANAAADRTTRNFYNADGLLTGSLSADGYLTQTDYDDAGQTVDTIAYANQASGSLWANGTFAQLQSNVGTSASDQHSYVLYDNRGLVAATVDPCGDVTSYTYNSDGAVITETIGQQVAANTPYTLATLPTATGALQATVYTYDGNGQVLTEGVYQNISGTLSGTPTTQVTNTYDSVGNQLSTVDLAGDTTSYTYNALNKVLTKTVYTTAAAGSTAASGAETSFYVYDAAGNLRYTVSASGDVTYDVVDNRGQITSTLKYTSAQYNTAGLSASTPISLSAMTTWQSNLTAAQQEAVERTDYAYDLSGQMTVSTAWSATDASGNGLTTSPYTRTTYVYDAAGQMVSKLLNDGSQAQTWSYDAFGRTISQTDAAGKTTTWAYNATAGTKTVTYANGLVDTQTYNGFGELVSDADSASNIATTTNSYIYDNDGNLRVSKDSAGVNTYYFYDSDNRKVGQVDGNGYLTEYKYDAANRLIATVTYATALTAAQLSSLAPPAAGVASTTSLTAIQPLSSATDIWNWTVYNAAGEVSQTIDAVGSVTGYTYDGTGAVIQTTQYATPLSAAQIAALIANTPGNNLVYNAGFNGTSGWHTYDPSGILAAPVAGNSQNVQILKVAFNATASNQSATIYGGAFSVTPGEKLNIQTGLEAYGPINFISLGVVWLNSSGNQISTSQVASNLGGSTNFNTQVSGSVTAPAGAVSAFIQLLMATSGSGSGAFDLDEPKVTIANPTLAPVAVTANAAADRTTRNFYNADGLLIGSLDPRGYLTQTDYDDAGQAVDTIAYATATSGSTTSASPNDQHSYVIYDNRGLVAATIDPMGDLTRYTYTASGKVATKVTGQQVTANTAYTLATLPAASGTLETTAYTYDGDGRVLTETLGQGTAQASTTSYTYDAVGNVLTATNGNGFVTTSTYDALGRLLTTSQAIDTNSAHNIVTTYTYDTRGNKTSETDGRGNTSYMYYDGDDRMVLSVDANGYATATSYNQGGQIASLTHYAAAVTGTYNASTGPTIVTTSGVDATTTFTYDAAGRTTGTTDAMGNTESYAYDAFGDRTQLTSKLGGVTNYYYDNAGNLLLQVSAAPATTSSVLGSYNAIQYTYDGFGNVWTKAEGYTTTNTATSGVTPLKTTTYTYNALNQLTLQSVSLGGSSSANTAYTYDAQGNVILEQTYGMNGATQSVLESTYTYYDVLNSMIAQVNALGVLTTYSYDKDSNLVGQTVYATPLSTLPTPPASGSWPTPPAAPAAPYNGPSRTTVYTYDDANRLLSTTAVSNTSVTGDSIITGSWSTSSSSYGSTTGNLTSSTVYDANGNVIEATDAAGNVTYSYYDKNNNKVAQVDADHYLTTYSYDSNGNVTQEYAYANKVGIAVTTATTVASLTASAGINSLDRITQFAYDKNGNRLTETRLNVAIVTIAGTTWLTTTNGSTAVAYTGTAPYVGEAVSGTGIPAGATIASVNTAANTATLSVAATASSSVAITLDAITSSTTSITTTNGSTGISYTGTVPVVGQPIIGAGIPTGTTVVSVNTGAGTAVLTAAATRSGTTPVSTTILANSTITYTYNAINEVLTQVQATGEKTTYTYDNLGRLATTLTATGQTTSEVYNALNNVTSSTSTGASSATRVTTYTYDAAGRLASMTGPGVDAIPSGSSSEVRLTTWYTYDAQGNLISQSQMRNVADNTSAIADLVTNYQYDALNRQVAQQSSYLSEQNAGSTTGATWQYGDVDGVIYNAFGEVAATTVNGGAAATAYSSSAPVPTAIASASTTPTRTTQFVYDAAGHLIASNSGDGTWKAYVTDGNGNATLTIQTLGVTDLSSLLTTQQASSGGSGVLDTSTYNQASALALATNSGANPAFAPSGVTVSTTNASSTISFSGGALYVGEAITGAGIAQGTTISSVSGTTAVLSNAATVTGSFTLGAELTVNGTTSAKFTGSLYAGEAVSGTGIAAGTTISSINAAAGTAVLSTAATASGTITLGSQVSTTMAGVEVTVGVFDARNQQTATLQPQRQTDMTGDVYAINTSQAFDAFGDVINQTDARGNTTQFTFDTLGRQTAQISPQVSVANGNGTSALGNPTEFAYYDISGREIATLDADGNLTTQALAAGTGYNGSQALATAIYRPDLTSTSATYDVYGDVLTQTDAMGYVTTNSYDNSGNLIQVILPATTTNTDGATGARTSAVLTNGSSSVSYSAGGSLWVGESVSGAGIAAGTTITGVNAAANTATLSTAATASGTVQVATQLVDYYAYDGLAEKVSEWNSQLGAVSAETTAYDAQGRVISTSTYVTSSTSYTTTYSYAWNGSLGANNGLGAYGGWIKTTTDVSAGETSSSGTDAFGHQITKTDMGGQVYSFTYNKAGELVAQSNSNPLNTIQALADGARLTAGQSVYSQNGQFWLIYQTDGNLVVYGPARSVVWAINAGTQSPGYVIMQADGNLVAYNSSGSAYWSSKTVGNSGATLSITNNGQFEIISPSNSLLWSTSAYSTAVGGSGGENLNYVFYNTGKVASITDNSNALTAYYNSVLNSTFTYDTNGNRLNTSYVSTNVSYSVYGHGYGSTTTVLENATATYDALNRLVSITDPGTSTRPSYTQTQTYDANGNIIENRTVHQNIGTNQAVTAATIDDYWYAYDVMNRVLVSEGDLSGTVGAAGVHVVPDTSGSLGSANILARTGQTAGTAIAYNADGEEVSSITYTSRTVSHNVHYSKYSNSTDYETYAQEIEQLYAYSAQGNLVTTSVAENSGVFSGAGRELTFAVSPLGSPVIQASDTRDALGRVMVHSEYDTSAEANSLGNPSTTSTPGTVIYSSTYTYNNASQVLTNQISEIQYNSSSSTDTNTVANTTYSYGTVVAAGGTASASSYADGNVISQNETTTTYQGSSGTSSPSTTTIATTNTYLWLDSAQLSSIRATYTGGSNPGTTTSTFDYDRNGHVSEVDTTGTNAHTNTYTESAAGLVMENQEILNNGGSASNSAPETFYFYLDDQLVGQIGNNGTTNVNYTTSINNQTTTGNNGAFANGATSGTSSANFDENYYAINASGNGEAATASTYTVQSGDTLQSIAASVYGDANLWYVIADANGLDASSNLNAGTMLTIPSTVENAGNTASTFKPYNANAALGDVSPGAPVPPAQNSGCGSLGEILMAVVAVAVAAAFATIPGLGPALDTALVSTLGEAGADIAVGAVAGIVGNVASQGFGLAIGAESSFNFGSLAMAAIGGAVGGGVSTTGIFDNLPSVLDDGLTAVTSNIVTQGIGVATGLQQNFDWAGVAGSAAGAVVGGALSREFTGDPDFKYDKYGNVVGVGNPDYGAENFGQSLVSGMAGDIVDAASRSVLSGTDFGKNLLAALPDTIGNTIGNAVAGGIGQSSYNYQNLPITGLGTDAPISPVSTEALDNLNYQIVSPESEGEDSPIAAASSGSDRPMPPSSDNSQQSSQIVVNGRRQWTSYNGIPINHSSAYGMNSAQYLLSNESRKAKIGFIIGLEKGHLNGGSPGSGIVGSEITRNISDYVKAGGLSLQNATNQVYQISHLIDEAANSLNDGSLQNSQDIMGNLKLSLDYATMLNDNKPLGNGGLPGVALDGVVTMGAGLVEDLAAEAIGRLAVSDLEPAVIDLDLSSSRLTLEAPTLTQYENVPGTVAATLRAAPLRGMVTVGADAGLAAADVVPEVVSTVADSGVDAFVSGLRRTNTPSSTLSGQFEIEQTGAYNYRVPGGGTAIDVDGYSGQTLLDAKYIGNPEVSPYVTDSNVPAFLKQKILNEQSYEIERYGAVIRDPAVPFNRLEILTNEPRSVSYFESLMQQHNVPGGVRVVPSNVPRSLPRKP